MDLLKKYLKFCFSYKGRLNRKAFAVYFFNSLFAVLCLVLPFLLLPEGYKPPLEVIVVLVAILVSSVTVIGSGVLSCFVRRAHDLGFSGWWIVTLSILSNIASKIVDDDGNSVFPDIILTSIAWGILLVFLLIGIVLYFFLFFKKGTKGPNQYGPDPLKIN